MQSEKTVTHYATVKGSQCSCQTPANASASMLTASAEQCLSPYWPKDFKISGQIGDPG